MLYLPNVVTSTAITASDTTSGAFNLNLNVVFYIRTRIVAFTDRCKLMDSERAPLTDGHTHHRDEYVDSDELEQIRSVWSFDLRVIAVVRSDAKESSIQSL